MKTIRMCVCWMCLDAGIGKWGKFRCKMVHPSNPLLIGQRSNIRVYENNHYVLPYSLIENFPFPIHDLNVFGTFIIETSAKILFHNNCRKKYKNSINNVDLIKGANNRITFFWWNRKLNINWKRMRKLFEWM